MFHATLPLVRWSSVENLRARAKGCSYVVDEVMPKERDFVTEAIAAMARLFSPSANHDTAAIRRLAYNGSDMGNCAAPGNAGSMLSGPLYTS